MPANAESAHITEAAPEHHRNPYVVLNVEPVFEADLWDTLRKLGLTADVMKVRLQQQKWMSFTDMPADERLLAWKRKLAKSTPAASGSATVEDTAANDAFAEMRQSEESVRTKEALTVIIEHYQQFIAAKQEGANVDSSQRALLAECQKYLTLLPETQAAVVGAMPTEEESLSDWITDDEGKRYRNKVVAIPQIDDIRAWAVRLQEALKAVPEEKKPAKKSKKKNAKDAAVAAEPVVSPADDVAGKLSTHADMRLAHETLRAYEDIQLKAWQIADEILHMDDPIQQQYRDLAMKFHPDRNPGNNRAAAMFKEANFAYDQLTNASREEREQLARDMVFGQNTGVWTTEMRTLTDGVTKMLAGLFAMQESVGMDPETEKRCPACADGVVLMQKGTDYLPVPLVCGSCGGTGAVKKELFETRDAIEEVVTKKKKKK